MSARETASSQITAVGLSRHLLIRGSETSAAGHTLLRAEDQLNLVAAQNSTQESSRSRNSSGSIGVGINLGSNGVSAGVTLSASAGKGQGAGDATSYSNSQISGSRVTLESGGDTTLRGAVVQGERVRVTAGGNLGIESLQDHNQYREKSQQVGGSVTFGPSPAGSLSAGQTKINSDFLSVGEQSAIRAGDGGFDVQVAGKTQLTGAQITSTQAAIDQDNNRYEAKQGTTTTDLQNSARYEAKSVSVGLAVGTPKPGASLSTGLSGVGLGSDTGSASSTSTAGISGMAGNTAARTGEADTGLKPIFDKGKARQEVNAQVAITSEFGKQASKAVGDYAKQQYDQAKEAGDKQGMAAWEEGGQSRVALHVLVGGLTGGVHGAVGAGAASAAAPKLEELQAGLKTALKEAGLGDNAANLISGLAGGATAATIGAAASGGNTAGAVTAFNADINNRQLHPTEKQRIKELAKGDAQEEARLTAAACALVKCYAEYPEGSAAYNALKAMADAGSSDAMAAERQQLQVQKGLFNYGSQGVLSDKNIDTAKQLNNTYQTTTRTVGAGLALLGGVGVAGSVATAPASCATGLGCVANAAVATISADAAITGLKQAVSGQPENTYLNQALQGLGLSPEAASYAEFALGVGAAAKVGSVVNTATSTQAANNAAARMSYEDIAKFGAKGLNVTPEVMQTPQAKALIAEYRAAGVPADDAMRYSWSVLKTGESLPIVRTVSANEELIKVVPKNVAGNDGVGACSPYFMTRSEYDALSKLSPSEIGQRLGLPAEQSVRGEQLGFDAFAITPKPGTAPKVFTSTVAPVEQGVYKAVGGGHNKPSSPTVRYGLSQSRLARWEAANELA